MNIFFKQLRLLVVFYLVAISSLAHSQNMQAEMADFINGFHNFKQFNGNVLVAKDGKVLFEQSVGYANFEWDIKHSNKSCPKNYISKSKENFLYNIRNFFIFY